MSVAAASDAHRTAHPPLWVAVLGAPGHGKTAVLRRLHGGCAVEPDGSREALILPTGEGTTERPAFIEEVPLREGTGALVSTTKSAQVAVVVIDAREDLNSETRRQMWLAALLGVGEIVVVVNKMDLVDYAEGQFRSLEQQSRSFARALAPVAFTAIPTAALHGDNVTRASEQMEWCDGPPLSECLGRSPAGGRRISRPFRMVVERADESPPNAFAGTVATGIVRPGDAVVVAPASSASVVERVIGAAPDNRGSRPEQDLEFAVAGEPVTLMLRDPIAAATGDLIATADAPPGFADQFEATVIWICEQPMLRGRSYLLRSHGREVTATIAPLKYKLLTGSPEHVAATKLERDEVGVCELELSDPIAFDPFDQNRQTGTFTLFDRVSGAPVGFGLIHFALRRSQNLRWQAVDVDKRARALSMGQRPTVLWMTGLSGSGKSTVANLVETELHRRGHHTYMLDGDNVRHGLNADLGFTEADRVENIRRVSEVAQLMLDAGLIVIVSFISPFRAERETARALFEPGEFVEIYLDTPLEVAEARDTKGLYKKARSGQLVNFTGIDSPYEPPAAPDVHLRTTELTPEAGAVQVIELLEDWGRLRPPPIA